MAKRGHTDFEDLAEDWTSSKKKLLDPDLIHSKEDVDKQFDLSDHKGLIKDWVRKRIADSTFIEKIIEQNRKEAKTKEYTNVKKITIEQKQPRKTTTPEIIPPSRRVVIMIQGKGFVRTRNNKGRFAKVGG